MKLKKIILLIFFLGGIFYSAPVWGGDCSAGEYENGPFCTTKLFPNKSCTFNAQCLSDACVANPEYFSFKFKNPDSTPTGMLAPAINGKCMNQVDLFCPSNLKVCLLKQPIGQPCVDNFGCKSNYCGTGQGDEKKCLEPDTGAGYLKFAPIKPILEIKIPTLQPFTTEGLEKPDAEGNIYFPFIGQYIVGIYKWMLLVAGIVATIMIILGGFTYLTSGGNATRAGEGKERITSAIFGLILLLGSYMLLYLINPGLVEFRSLKIKIIEREEIEAGAETSDQVYYGQSTDIGCFFSNFGQTVEDVKNNLVTVQFLNKNYQVHKKMAPALTAAAAEIKGLNYNIKTGAAFPGYWRENVNNPKKMSLHSFGIALDINSEENPNYHRPSNEICDTSPCSNPCKTNIPKEIINALNKNGFRWGGNFKKVCDSMHFEWLGPCAKDQQ